MVKISGRSPVAGAAGQLGRCSSPSRCARVALPARGSPAQRPGWNGLFLRTLPLLGAGLDLERDGLKRVLAAEQICSPVRFAPSARRCCWLMKVQGINFRVNKKVLLAAVPVSAGELTQL